MKTKLYVFIEDAPYRKGVERYLELTKEKNKDIELIDNPGKINRNERALLLTDSQDSEMLKHNNIRTYHLTDRNEDEARAICKFNSFENILSDVFSREGEDAERKEFKLLCLSSIRAGAGKSLIAEEAAKILAESSKTALINIYPSRDAGCAAYQLDELMLSSMNGSRIELEEQEDGFYMISPFKLIEDYVELDIKSFHKLLRELNENKGIENFVVESRHFLDKTSRELISLANINLVIIEEEDENNEKELNYIKGLTSKEGSLKIIRNKVKRMKKEDELPYVYGLEHQTEYTDFRHFISTLRQILEEL